MGAKVILFLKTNLITKKKKLYTQKNTIRRRERYKKKGLHAMNMNRNLVPSLDLPHFLTPKRFGNKPKASRLTHTRTRFDTGDRRERMMVVKKQRSDIKRNNHRSRIMFFL